MSAQKESRHSSENNRDSDSKILSKDFAELIKFIPPENQEEAIKIISSITIKTASSFSGPLPPPSILEGYNEVLDRGAERVMKMAENQSSHRIELEKHAIKEELKQSKNGQIFGFILALVGMGIAFGLALYGHDTVAGIFGTTTIIGLVTVFVIGKKYQKSED